MTKEERDNLAARFRRMSEGHKQYQNIYHDGVAEGFLKAAVVVEKIEPEQETTDIWLRYGEDGYPNDVDTVYWQCGRCLNTEIGRREKPMQYCPHCGTRMVEGSPDEE